MDNAKLTSSITKLILNEATFHQKELIPSYINFIFGNNGSGKSTIAKAIYNKTGIVWETGYTSDDFTILVYNEDFIKRNIASYGGMPGVFTISEQNTTVIQKIEEATVQLNDAQATYNLLSQKLSDCEKKLKNEYTTFQNVCWEKTKIFRNAVAAAMDGKKTKDGLAKAILSEITPQENNEPDLITMCEAAFDANATTYSELFTADASNLPTTHLLTKKIVSSGDGPFATFMKAINATNWVRQGHEEFHESASGKCPYCQRELTNEFETELAKCFDAEYESDLQALAMYKTEYGTVANSIWSTFSNNLKNAYPKIESELKSYAALFETFKAKMQLNAKKLEEKITNPEKSVELEDLSEISSELNSMINVMNNKIRENNLIVNDKHKKQEECKKLIVKYLAHFLMGELDNYRTHRSNLQKEIDELTAKKVILEKQLSELKVDISTLRRNVVNTIAAIDGINSLLKDTGFQGFYIREKDDTPNVYEVVRTSNNKVAENLSEGERNFIAFLYFHQLVLGSEKADSIVRNKIVVIDDPVSSMDSSSLFVVGALVRDMIAICNPDYITKECDKDYIKQLFVLTHNAFFHQEVTYNQVQNYNYVSFFEITKMDNQSEIIPCTQRNRETPSIFENRNPVQNSYAALWDTYREALTPSTLVNTIRQILDYYFLQLCGYNGIDIKEQILKNHRSDFVQILPDGTEDAKDLHMASSLLQYLCTSNDRISDGLNFIHTSVDVDSCRRIFESIFRHMGQGQHYDMMTKR